MDPLSITVAITGLLTFCTEINHYLSGVKQASTNALKLYDQISVLQNVLGQLSQFLGRDDMRNRHFAETSALVQSTKICRRELNQILRGLEKGNKSIVNRMKFPFEEKDIRQYIDKLRGYIGVFEVSLSISGCALMSETADNVAASLQVQLETSEHVVEMTKKMTAMTELFEETIRAQERTKSILLAISSLPNAVTQITSLTRSITGLEVASKDEKETAVLKWLCPLSLGYEKHDRIKEERTPNTDSWIFDAPAFQTWLTAQSDQRAIICLGRPGVGKTFLTSFVIDHLLDSSENYLGVAWFYCDYTDGIELNHTAFAASLLRQLAMQLSPFPKPVLEYYDLFRNDSSQKHSNYLVKTLLQICSMFQPCFILVDGLDEVPPNFRKHYIKLLQTLQKASVKIFITARPYLRDLLSSSLEGFFENVEAREGDIKSFILDTIAKNEDSNETLDENLRDDVVKSLSANADGMFLLAALHLRTILDQVRKSEVRKILRSLSTNLQTVFESFLERIKTSGSRQKIAFAVLTWLAYARRPLSVEELRHALATDLGDAELENGNFVSLKVLTESCLGLVVFDERSSMVRFVHFSLQEYVQAQRLELFPGGDNLIAATCLTYMRFPSMNFSLGGEDTDQLIESYPFLGYSCYYWGYHASFSIESPVKELAAEFLFDSIRVASILEFMYWNSRQYWDSKKPRYPLIGNALHCISIFGLPEFIPELIQGEIGINNCDDQERTPLHIAIEFGQPKAVKVLLELGASTACQISTGDTPLFIACGLGNIEIVQLLLQNGQDPNASCTDDWTPVHKAVDRGHLQVLKLLLQNGGQPRLKSIKGLTALHRACGRGHVEITQLLLSLDSNVDPQTMDGWNPLHGAASSGRTAVVRILLEKGACVNHVSNDGCTALHRACLSGHIETVKILLQFGAHRSIPDILDEIPLHKAARRGSEQIVELLLNTIPKLRDTQLGFTNCVHQFPRHAALAAGHYDLATQLAQTEVDKDYFTKEIESAIRSDNLKSFIQLFADGIDNEMSDQNGLSLFHRAISQGSFGIASYLAKCDSVDVERSAHNGWTPLHTASRRGDITSVELCLEHGAQVNRKDRNGRTSLFQACSGGNTDIVRSLVEKGASPHALDDDGLGCLYVCAEAGHEDVARLLIFNYRVSFDKEQAVAAEAGHHDLVEFFRIERYKSRPDLSATEQYKFSLATMTIL